MENFGTYESRKIADYFKDPRKLMEAVNKNKKTLFSWIGFFMIVYAIFELFSSGDFSFVLTLGSLIQMFGFLLLAIKTYGTRSVSGVSKNSLICYTICLFARLISIMFYDGYLPYDKSGDIIYRLAELISFASCSFVLYLTHQKYKASYNWDLDKINWVYFTVPTLVLSILFHPSLNMSRFADIPWTFAMYLEAFAMFPQIDLFRKKGGEIETFTGTFVASSGISKFLQFVFWIFTYAELNDEQGSSLTPTMVGYYVIIFQLVQLAIIFDYLWFYFKSLNTGTPLYLPQSYVV